MSPTTHDLLHARLKLVRVDLDEITAKLTQEMLDWAPAAGVRTYAGQLFEIAAVEMQTIASLTERKQVFDKESAEIFGDCSSLSNLLRVLKETRHRTLQVLDSYSESQLAEQVGMAHPWFVTSALAEVPRSEVFISIAQHEWYHVGQLVTYCWIQGDDPYNW
jgi:hypothetical protein